MRWGTPRSSCMPLIIAPPFDIHGVASGLQGVHDERFGHKIVVEWVSNFQMLAEHLFGSTQPSQMACEDYLEFVGKIVGVVGVPKEPSPSVLKLSRSST